MKAERGEFSITSDPSAVDLDAVHLVTRDAHALYRQVVFSALAAPDRHMEMVRQVVYAGSSG